MTVSTHTTDVPSTSSAKIGPDDPRYQLVVEKRFNKRFIAQPDYVRVASSPSDVIAAVQDAVEEDRRLVVTSGGHCLEGFVADPDVRVILDVSPMKRVYYDDAVGAIAVEAGATVGEAFRALFQNWGVVVPFGEYPGVGIGGHVAGGAFGFLCRELGLAADYLYAVEVVTVDADGGVAPLVATREPSDPHRELWWGHTGAGGGNFGVVTRYLFRGPNESGGGDPTCLLPRAPASITTFTAAWSWDDIDRERFQRLLQNHGTWAEQNSGVESRGNSLWTLLEIHRKQFGKIIIRGLSTDRAGGERRIDDYLTTLGAGVGAVASKDVARMSWLDFALDPFPDLFGIPPGGVSVKVKDALLKRQLTDRQIDVAYDYLTSASSDVMGGVLGMASYGGRVNAVEPDATASSHRAAILDMACNTGWIDPGEADTNLRWVREFYRDLFAATGGVPVPGDEYDGSLINHPDVDLTDPAWNQSEAPWYTVYYKSNYPRLQRIKSRYDPRNVFRHALSIRGA